jgi:CheY-like chemotaxis protein
MAFHLLLIDDDPMVIFIHKAVLSQEKMLRDSLAFHHANEAISFLQANNRVEETFLILLDINMPRMDGWDFLDAIKQIEWQSTFHIIMVTSSISDDDRAKSTRYPLVIDYLIKPLGQEGVQRILKHPRLQGVWESV